MINITSAGTHPSAKGPADYFTGTVRIDGPFQGEAPARISGATVTFEPGARTAWHTHPLGQTLIVTSGIGLIQALGEPVKTIKPGDVVWIASAVKHWHGASAKTAMTHIAVAESVDGNAVEWLEQVTDEVYGQQPQ